MPTTIIIKDGSIMFQLYFNYPFFLKFNSTGLATHISTSSLYRNGKDELYPHNRQYCLCHYLSEGTCITDEYSSNIPIKYTHHATCIYFLKA